MMPIIKKIGIPVAAALWAASAAVPATAAAMIDGSKSVVQFYTEFLSKASSPNTPEIAKKILAPDWKSIGSYDGKVKSRDMIIKQIGGFGKLIPNLSWKVEEIIQSGDRYVVRGRASGTPVGPLFGVNGEGRSFDIMSIDIHRVKNGQIVESYHVENWAGALGQLKGKSR